MTPMGAAKATPRHRVWSWLEWVILGSVYAVAAYSVVSAFGLRGHAEQRHRVVTQLREFEVAAHAQSNRLWKGLTYLMAGENMRFVRLRGQEQFARSDMFEQLDALRELEKQGALHNGELGFPPAPELLDALQHRAHSFLSSVQGTLSQMRLSLDRVRQRLRHWDANFGNLREALDTAIDRNTKIATRAAEAGDEATLFAGCLALLTLALFVVRMTRMRGQRERELHTERLLTLAASEARLKALVQNGSDLLLIVEPSGAIRYASPSCEALLGMTVGEATNAFLPELFRVTLEDFVRQQRLEVVTTSADGTPRLLEAFATDLRSHPDVEGVILNARDVTERKALEERMRHQALHDPLTDLPNRRLYQQTYRTLGDEKAAVLFVDLDGFKLVNDSHGHRAGDVVLQETACRLRSCLSEGDLLARQGGDEFLVLLIDNEDPGAVADSIQQVMGPPFAVNETEAFLSASIGIIEETHGLDADEAVQRADIAMYRAKKTGRAKAVTFDPKMLEDAPERLQLEADFRHALERDEFTVHYQPKVGFGSGRTESLEALVRWEHPTRGMVRPDVFIGFAEESGLICELGRRVLEQACHDAVRWQDRDIIVAVNLSPIQFRNPRLVEEVRSALQDSGLDPKLLELEITESAVLGDVAATTAVLDQLKALGVRLAIDDFGTGYSNLSHLKHFNVDVLKIDQSFVRGGDPATESLCDGAIVEAVIAMARAFDLHVVAEGVETEQHASELHALGADLGQGYFFSKPVAADTIDELIAAEVAKETNLQS